MNCTISINLARHTSQAPVLCQKSAHVTGHRGQCQIGPMCDNAKKSKISSKTGHFTVLTTYFIHFGSCGLWPPPNGLQTLKLPIWALSTLSQSPAICVEVPNWSNVSQSQGCAELNEMVQYWHYISQSLQLECSFNFGQISTCHFLYHLLPKSKLFQ